jgi:hypothetical protein
MCWQATCTISQCLCVSLRRSPSAPPLKPPCKHGGSEGQ